MYVQKPMLISSAELPGTGWKKSFDSDRVEVAE